ncbi:MAG TPA: hypothetical protein VLI45_02680 [Acidobacteriaceae bacterium]|nr:hypothetical protein [Acidobacteriaceae bacterium]
MKLSTLSAKLTGSKAVRALSITALAAGALAIAAPAAQAQHVRFGISIGTPVYVAPAPEVVYTQPAYYNGYYHADRFAAVRAHEAWERHEAWEHARRFDRDDFRHRDFDHDRRFDRNHFDRR